MHTHRFIHIKGITPDERCLYTIDDMIFTKEEILSMFESDRNGAPEVMWGHNFRWPSGPGVNGQMAYEFNHTEIPYGHP